MPDFKVSKKDLLVTDSENQAVYAIRKNKEIRDLYGNVIAEFSSKEKRKVGDKRAEVAVYNSEKGTFACTKDKLFLNDELVGNVTKQHIGGRTGSSNLSIVMLSLAALVGTFVFISLINTPISSDPIPVFDVVDNNGNWEEQGTIEVFDDAKIYPGKSGKYEFVMTNESVGKLLYGLSLSKEIYYGNLEYNYFMQYRLKMNNKYISNYKEKNPEEWLRADELIYENIVFLPATQQLMTLEWQWPFESGNDESDTQFGIEASKYSIVLSVKAEVYID